MTSSKATAPRVRDQVSREEWDQRVALAAAYRLVAHFHWDDLIFTHLSARVPGPEHHFLINPYGTLFDEITASSHPQRHPRRARGREGPAARVCGATPGPAREVRDLGPVRVARRRIHPAPRVGRVREAHASGTPLHVGRTIIVVQVDIRDDDGKRVALVTQTQAVIPRAEG